MPSELQAFVRESLSRGLPRDRVKSALIGAGWRAEEVDEALAAYAEVDFPVPVPRRRPHVSAREAFLYLVLFATLYITAFDVGMVLFHLIDRALPDAARGRFVGDAATAGARAGTAGLVIAFPVFLALSRLVGRTLEREPGGRSSPIRKWLTYLTLFIAALVLIGDLIALVGRLLAGELALRFGLKALVVFAIAAAVFGHYLTALRREERDVLLAPPRARLGARLAAVAVVVVAALGLFASGPPARERRRQLDAIRVRDLQAIAAAVSAHRAEYGALPGTIDRLIDQPPPLGVGAIQDPETQVPYDYRAIDSLTYELCAVFTEPDTGDAAGAEAGARFWRHGAGRQCFRLRALRRERLGGAPYEVVPAEPVPLPR